jgi:hypothetical protein
MIRRKRSQAGFLLIHSPSLTPESSSSDADHPTMVGEPHRQYAASNTAEAVKPILRPTVAQVPRSPVTDPRMRTARVQDNIHGQSKDGCN